MKPVTTSGTKNSATLSSLSNYRTGGTCESLYLPSSLVELQKDFLEIKAANKPYFILGKGSNSLVWDDPWPGAVIGLANMRDLEILTSKNGLTYVRVGAGVENTTIAEFLLSHKLKGGSWLYTLPGQIGGTVRMNARCFGGEASQIVHNVKTIGADGHICFFENSGIFRGYKDTVFMNNGHIIGEVTLAFESGDPKEIEIHMKSCREQREARGHFIHPSCGCVFKNNYQVGIASGELLDKAGAKLLSQGRAQVSPLHANFIYNLGGATSRDILELSFRMQDLVYDAFGIWMEYEMEVLGRLPSELELRFGLNRHC